MTTITRSTRKQIRMTINHQYVGLRLTPLIGDFADQFRMANRGLYVDGVINEDTYYYNQELALKAERSESRDLINEMISILKFHSGVDIY